MTMLVAVSMKRTLPPGRRCRHRLIFRRWELPLALAIALAIPLAIAGSSAPLPILHSDALGGRIAKFGNGLAARQRGEAIHRLLPVRRKGTLLVCPPSQRRALAHLKGEITTGLQRLGQSSRVPARHKVGMVAKARGIPVGESERIGHPVALDGGKIVGILDPDDGNLDCSFRTGSSISAPLFGIDDMRVVTDLACIKRLVSRTRLLETGRKLDDAVLLCHMSEELGR